MPGSPRPRLAGGASSTRSTSTKSTTGTTSSAGKNKPPLQKWWSRDWLNSPAVGPIRIVGNPPVYWQKPLPAGWGARTPAPVPAPAPMAAAAAPTTGSSYWGGGGGGWSAQAPTPVDTPYWWWPGLFNWRYGINF